MREILIAVGRASGATMEEVAVQAGVTVRMLQYDIAADGTIDEIQNLIQPLIKQSRREIKAIAAAMADKEMEKLLGPAFASITDVLMGGGDPKTAAANAWKVIHQLRGTPAATLKMEKSGTVTHRHELYVMPRKTLQALGEDIAADAELMAAARQLAAPAEQPLIGQADKAKAIDIESR